MTSRRPSRAGAAPMLALALLAWPRPALAGMPTIVLTDLAFTRLSTLSFFGLVFLLSAAAVRAIWNSLTTDLPRLPASPTRRRAGWSASGACSSC